MEITLRLKISAKEYPELVRMLNEETNQMRRTRSLVSLANRQLMSGGGEKEFVLVSQPTTELELVAKKERKPHTEKIPSVPNKVVRGLPDSFQLSNLGSSD